MKYLLIILTLSIELCHGQNKSTDLNDPSDWTEETYLDNCQTLQWMIEHEPTNGQNGGSDDNMFKFIKWCSIGVDKFPGKPYAYFIRGKAKFLLDDKRGGVSDLEKSIKLNINKGEAYFWIASQKLRINEDDYQSAFSYINTAIIKLQQEGDKYYLGESYIVRGMIKIVSLKKKNEGCLDLSKAGEIGSTRVYELISKFCN